MPKSRIQTTELNGRRVSYSLTASRFARQLRVRVGPRGVEVVQPAHRTPADVQIFLLKNAPWVLAQMRRVEGLRTIRRPAIRHAKSILFRGEITRIKIEATGTHFHGNSVRFTDGQIVIQRGPTSQTPASRSLELWLRRLVRVEVERLLELLTTRLRCKSGRVYIMGQRTKWGNCSAEKNLSFNWRLIHAPEFVLQYIVTHETVHLAVPDHSAKFWLTVQSLCPKSERAKQWLCTNGQRLLEPLPVLDAVEAIRAVRRAHA